MDAIPPDIAKKLLNRDFANLVKRVQAGGKINRTERTMLQSMASDAGGDGPAYVRNFVELAVALKVIRRIDVHPVERWFKVTTFDNREVIYRGAGDEIEIVSSESPVVLAVPKKAKPTAQATRLKTSNRSD